MRICIAQTRPIKGDIQRNIDSHRKFIDLAIANGADTIIFPELSLTGYEPALASELATSTDDIRLNDFQEISDANQITIGVGMPTKTANGICISMIIFQPHQTRQTYSKKYLHADEYPFFVSGQNSINSVNNGGSDVALAICYELSIPDHSESAFKSGAKIYLASVAKSAAGVEEAVNTLSNIGRKYAMTVLMSNSVGYCDNFESAGNTSIWNDKGLLVGQLDNISEGILMIDTSAQELIQIYV